MDEFLESLAPMEARVFRLLEAKIPASEIASLLGISRNNLNQILFRIRKKGKVIAARATDSRASSEAGDV